MRRLFFISATLLCLCIFASAKDNPERTQFGRDIYVQPGEKVGDVTCFGCSIHVRGQVTGDATAFGGSIVVEDGASVTGDVTTFAGGIRALGSATITGDATTFGGYLRRDPQATISGDVSSFSGFAWLLALLAVPLLFLIGIVAVIVWLVRRNRPVGAPAYSSAPSTRV